MLQVVILAVGLLCAGLAPHVDAAVADAARDVIVVLDNSGSMRKVDPARNLVTAVRAFIAGLPADARAGLIVFDRDDRLVVPLAPLDDAGRAHFTEALDKAITYRGARTNSPAAVERAIYELKLNSRPEARRAIVFFSDGIVDTGSAAADAERTAWLREDLTAEAAANRVGIFSIAFTEKADLLLLQSMARRTGGEYFRAAAARDLSGAFEQVRAALAAEPPAAAASGAPPPAEARASTDATPTPAAVPAPNEVQDAAGEPPAATAPPVPAPAESHGAAVEPPGAMTAPAPASPTAQEPENSTAAPSPAPVAATAHPEAGTTTDKDVAQFLGISQEELDKMPPGQVVVLRPGEPLETHGSGAGPWAWAAAGLALIVIGGGAVLFLRRRRQPGSTEPVKAPEGPKALVPERPAAPSVAPQGPEAVLHDVSGTTGRPSHLLGSKPVVLGRVAGNEPAQFDYIVLNQGTVGRRHAVIELRSDGYWLVDQGSVNGSFVNGVRVNEQQRLRNHDRIRLHTFEFEFEQQIAAEVMAVSDPAALDQTIAAGAPIMAGRTHPTAVASPVASTPEVKETLVAAPVPTAPPRVLPRTSGLDTDVDATARALFGKSSITVSPPPQEPPPPPPRPAMTPQGLPLEFDLDLAHEAPTVIRSDLVRSSEDATSRAPSPYDDVLDITVEGPLPDLSLDADSLSNLTTSAPAPTPASPFEATTVIMQSPEAAASARAGSGSAPAAPSRAHAAGDDEEVSMEEFLSTAVIGGPGTRAAGTRDIEESGFDLLAEIETEPGSGAAPGAPAQSAVTSERAAGASLDSSPLDRTMLLDSGMAPAAAASERTLIMPNRPSTAPPRPPGEAPAPAKDAAKANDSDDDALSLFADDPDTPPR